VKIVCVDNFDRETVSDFLVAENIQNEKFARAMCSALNDKFSGPDVPYFFKVKPDDYRLHTFDPT
jgi:hypothetical protein